MSANDRPLMPGPRDFGMEKRKHSNYTGLRAHDSFRQPGLEPGIFMGLSTA